MKIQINKYALTIILFIVAPLLVTACGEQAQELPEVVIMATIPPLPQPTATVEVVSEAVNSEEVISEDVVVGENGRSLIIWADDLRAPGLEMAAAAFETAVGDVTVVVEPHLLSDIRLNLLNGQGRPDIIVGSHTWVGELVANGLLTPLDLGVQHSQFVPVSLAAFTYNNTLYGMPNSTDNVAFFINQDLVPNCPATWTEVLTLSRTRSAQNSGDSATNQYGFVRMEGNAYHFFPIQSAFGGTIFGTDNGRYDVTTVGFDSAGSIAAATFYETFLVEGLQPPSMTVDTIRVWFETGRASMTIIGPWALNNFKTADVNYKICDIPSESAPGQALVEAQGFMIPSSTANPELAQRFLTDFVAIPETMQAIADVELRLSAYLPTRNGADPDWVAIGNVGAKGTPIPGIPEMATVWEPWETAVTLLARQQATPFDAFTNAAFQIRAAIENTKDN